LHRCFQRHGISRLPETQGYKPAKKKFKPYPIGYFHIDIAEVRTEEGKLYLFVAIDRTSKFAYAELHEKANRWIATDFLKALIKAVPYKIHTVLTDNGIQFTDLPKPGISTIWLFISLMICMNSDCFCIPTSCLLRAARNKSSAIVQSASVIRSPL
jgi:hypothetical protein